MTLHLINTLYLLSPHGSLKPNLNRIIVMFFHATQVISCLYQNAVTSGDVIHLCIAEFKSNSDLPRELTEVNRFLNERIILLIV